MTPLWTKSVFPFPQFSQLPMFVQVDKGKKTPNNPLDTKMWLFNKLKWLRDMCSNWNCLRNELKPEIRFYFAFCDSALWFDIRVIIKSLRLELLSWLCQQLTMSQSKGCSLFEMSCLKCHNCEQRLAQCVYSICCAFCNSPRMFVG